jgi:metal-responsive CopG/Arc/MetJ family transcriptional regulator
MPIADDKARIQAVVSKELVEKIDHLAERFEVSQSKMVSIMLEACLENDEWLMKLMSSAAAKKIARVFGVKNKKLAIEF